jgi:predicted peptidase
LIISFFFLKTKNINIKEILITKTVNTLNTNTTPTEEDTKKQRIRSIHPKLLDSSKEIIENTRKKFTNTNYVDPKTWLEIKYNLYVPEEYSEKKSFPLVIFLSDETDIWNWTDAPILNWIWWDIRATTENQKNFPCIIIVPNFEDDIINLDTKEKKAFFDIFSNMLSSLTNEYYINPQKIFWVWQWEWASVLMKYANENPNYFNSLLLINWWLSINNAEKIWNSRFIYFETDDYYPDYANFTKLKEYLEENKIDYTYESDYSLIKDGEESLINYDWSTLKDKNMIKYSTEDLSWLNISGRMLHYIAPQYIYMDKWVRDWLVKNN